MADIDNMTEINENFDTVKTLLNSIRAQGILNTSDVDKLLSGINAKLEKINTEEDIDIIKVFLTELKQNLDERHNVLVSKFGAIESLFSNLLKNSSELSKSSELKELFDIVATNLSVFSREVVAQKESLTDITLRLDALRSDDSQKKDIIKNITLLKPDLERLSNGFDTIVLSLNDNFKTLAKTLATIDKTEHLDKFADALNNIEMSSKALLSAIQLVDKKTEVVDGSIKDLVTKSDLEETGRNISELKLLNQGLNESVNEINQHYSKIDTLADKIDASVNIIAGLKSIVEENGNKNKSQLLDKINELSSKLSDISNNSEFEEFKSLLVSGLKEIAATNFTFDNNLKSVSDKISEIDEVLHALDVSTNFSSVLSAVDAGNTELKEHMDSKVQTFKALSESNLGKIIDKITDDTDSLNDKLVQTQSEISAICENNFHTVFDNIDELKNALSQMDENETAAKSAMFSNISDRLNLFETALKESLEHQELTANDASARLREQVENIKNLSGVIDYKMDSSVVEISNMTHMFEILKSSVDDVLALNFVEKVNDLRADIYASKQDLSNALLASESGITEKLSGDIFAKYELIISKLDSTEDEFKKTQTSSLAYLRDFMDKISASLVDILSYVSEAKEFPVEEIDNKFEKLSNVIKETNLDYIETVRDIVDATKTQVENDLNKIREASENRLESINKNINASAESMRADIKDSYEKLVEVLKLQDEIKGLINLNSVDNSTEFDKLFKNLGSINSEFDNRLGVLKSNILDKVSEAKNEFSADIKAEMETIVSDNNQARLSALGKIRDDYESLKSEIEKLSTENIGSRAETYAKLLENFADLKDYIQGLNDNSLSELTQNTNTLIEYFDSVKSILKKVDENVDGDMTRQLSIIESNFESLVSQMTILNEKAEQSLVEKINDEYKNISERIDNNVTQKLDEYKAKIEETFEDISQKTQEQSTYIQDRVSEINSVMKSVWEAQAEKNYTQIEEISDKLKSILDNNIEATEADYLSLKEKLDVFTKELGANNESLIQNLKEQLSDMTKYIDSVLDIQSQEADSHIDEFVKLIETVITKNNEAESKLIELNDKVVANSDTSCRISADINELSDKLISELEIEKQAIISIKDFMSEAMQNKLKSISKEIEKETDAIISELTDQFEAVKKSQQDFAIQITSGIESVVESQIYNNIEDLKSYLDIKTDSSSLANKLDNLKTDITSAFDSVITDLNKMLDGDVFTSAISDYRVANEILVNSAADRINEFVGDAVKQLSKELGDESKNIENKLALFDKKFVDTVVDKYEEIKLISNKCNGYFDDVKKSIDGVFGDFQNVRGSIDSKIDNLAEELKHSVESTNLEIRQLNECFEDLRAQISNKSFDEAFQASINKQIYSLESLIKEQLSSIEDINELCNINLPDISELNAVVRSSVIESLGALSKKTDEISEKIESENVEGLLEDVLKDTKADIITQFLNIFNQISFIAEQEEIIDFIQEKHDELITVLSHIVKTTSDISEVKDNVVAIDSKISSLKNEISQINEKITNIISSDGDIDYVYSLQDLESDIANLRIVLKDMQNNTDSYGNEFSNLMSSTENVYKLVESIKDELPDKKTFDSLAEDIISISTRTNKLILASDESYKTLQDNLTDFKLVIDDLDERTRNFAKESGMDKIDSKLNALNNMVQNGAKNNQVFNQVFQYLAEWVDNAGNQISAISNKVESLDDIGQIKVMLADLKAESEDNSENVELIEALGNVFDKQAKKIAALETKLDKMIVENTINNNKNKLDMKPMEDTLNKFLVAIGDKISIQQEKIGLLESKLEQVVNILDEKDTAQLTKKVGGMDKQIAKLNKSIEKIASHVVEK